MSKRNDAAAAPRPAPTHVKLGADWGPYRACDVIAADGDRLAQFDAEGVPYAPATDSERRLAGFI